MKEKLIMTEGFPLGDREMPQSTTSYSFVKQGDQQGETWGIPFAHKARHGAVRESSSLEVSLQVYGEPKHPPALCFILLQEETRV